MKFSHAVLVVLILHVIAVAGIFAFNSIKASQTTGARQSAPSKSVASDSAAAPAAGTQTASAAAPVEKPRVASAPAEASSGDTHTIQAGDTLTRVASLYGVTVAAIEKENAITSYSTLRVGQVLKIPQPTSGIKTSAPAEARPIAAAPSRSVSTGTVASVARPVAAASVAPAVKPAAPAPVATPKAAPEASSGEFYVVVKGDNPYSIAKRLHVSYTELLAVNHIDDPRKIQIGQKLKIPQKTN